MITTRHATNEDLSWIVGELKSFSDFLNTAVELFPGDEQASAILANMISEHFVLVAESDGEPAGFLIAYEVIHPMNPSIKLLSESHWWVVPKFRHTRAGLKLLNQFVDYGRRNADWISISLEDKSPVKDQTLFKRGFRPMERTFIMENI